MSDSTKKPRRKKVSKPPKPYPEFPLTPHNAGYWMKKIRGKIHYFGRWGKIVNGKMERLPGDGWEAALALYKAQADDLHAGRKPRVSDSPDGLTLRELCNKFWKAKQRKKNAGELSQRSLREYEQTTDRLIEFFGKDRLVDDLAADDFGELRAMLAAKFGPVRLSNEITRIKTVFKWGWKNGLIENAIRYGEEFDRPSKTVLRKHKAENGKKIFDAAEIRKLIEAAKTELKAMIYLGINCGFGNTDVANLTHSHIDYEGGWIDFPRPKTGIERRCPLWPETIKAIREAIPLRSEPNTDADADCVFLTEFGRWVRENGTDNCTLQFRKLSRKIGVHRQGVGFYALRHVFQTIADTARDPVAVKSIMGHADGTMSGNYREWVSDENLRDVAEHVRRWLFAGDDDKTEGTGPEKLNPKSCEPCDVCDADTSHENTENKGEVRKVRKVRKNADKVSNDDSPGLRLYVGEGGAA